MAISPWDLSAQQAQASRLKASGSTREQLTQAAGGFENFLVRKWLEAARKSSLEPKSGPMAIYDNMVDDQLAFFGEPPGRAWICSADGRADAGANQGTDYGP